MRAKGKAQFDALRRDFDRHLELDSQGSKVTSDTGLPAYRELVDALGLMGIASFHSIDRHTGWNARHDQIGMLAAYRLIVMY